jgi:thiamine-phosphate pyrophosphorylase
MRQQRSSASSRSQGIRLGPGLYLVTPEETDSARLLAQVTPLLRYSACLQYRSKRADDALRLHQARALRALCLADGIPFIVNDDIELAVAVDADGVHLGAGDVGIAHARARIGGDAIIGASCYNDYARAMNAAAAGADYVAFGAFFPSPTKPDAPRATTGLLHRSAGLGLPRVAIGGITPTNAAPLVAAGADLIAVISGVFDATDPVAAARACRALFD